MFRMVLQVFHFKRNKEKCLYEKYIANTPPFMAGIVYFKFHPGNRL